MKSLFIVVILIFALMAATYILGGTAMLLGLKVPGNPQTARYVEILDGAEGVGFGIAYGVSALGLYKRNHLARVLALILVVWNLFGALSNVFSDAGIVNLFWLCVTVFVPVCLYSWSVSSEFAAARTQEKVA
jgi:hypothetical protein